MALCCPATHRRLPFAVLAIAMAVVGYACAAQGSQPTGWELISVSELNSNKGLYVGKNVPVHGRIYVMTLSGLLSCREGQPCPKYRDALLTLVDEHAGGAVLPDEVVRLYRRSAVTGAPEQIHCSIVEENAPTFDCGRYVNGTVTSIDGLFTQDRVPDLVVGDSSGHLQVVTYRNDYFLVID